MSKTKEKFKVNAPFKPAGDQPKAIEKLVKGIKKGYKFQTLLGATGTGKTFTMAKIIEKVQKPTLVISHNKTLAAQLASEFKDFFPNSSICYFVSYYDFYQPEAYIPQTDTYIDKQTEINEEIDRLRHQATKALLSRKDVIVVASVSCIYGLGNPFEYKSRRIILRKGEEVTINEVLRKLEKLRYIRSDFDVKRGSYSVKGNRIEIFQAFAIDELIRIEFFGNQIEKILFIDPLNPKFKQEVEFIAIYPATHYLAPIELEEILKEIQKEMINQIKYFKKQGRLIEAERIKKRTLYDIEMLRATGYCNGIENYSRYFDGRMPGEPPFCLIDYFPEDFLIFIDESHITLPQLRGMYASDNSRKRTLIEYGFRLPSALDNRPLKFEEFEEKINQIIFVSATPGEYELKKSKQIVEQLIRPTGILDPEIEVRSTKNQIKDLLKEIKKRIKKGERVLITTLTKRLAEHLDEYLRMQGIKSQYLHSEINTLERLPILRRLRKGEIDVVVGINLLREGLDLPEVSLVIILDADKQGYLRSDTALIQTIGRAARHINGKVIMYADKITISMKKAIDETKRRRKIQIEFNKKYKITPTPIKKDVKKGILGGEKFEIEVIKFKNINLLSEKQKKMLLKNLKAKMDLYAKNWEFEKAAKIRDILIKLKSIY